MREHQDRVPISQYPEIIIKFQEGGRLEEIDGQLRAEHLTLERFYHILKSVEGAQAYRTFSMETDRLREMRDRASKRLNRPLPSLDLFVRVRLTRTVDIDSLIKQFDEDPETEYACLAGAPGPLPSPNYTDQQVYQNPAPDGVNAPYAWSFPGGDGSGVQVCVCEYSFNPNHEDLPTVAVIYPENGVLPPPPANTPGPDPVEHGTNTIGVLAAVKDTKGVTGICHGATMLFACTLDLDTDSVRIHDWITTANSFLNEGDVLVLEMQTDAEMPWEYNADIHEAVRTAVGLGIVVVAAAGNGDVDLTQATNSQGLHIWDPNSPEENDSGAIIVGGGISAYSTDSYAPPCSRRYPSNFGKRVNCQGWGENVVTAGWNGDDPNGSNFNPGSDLHFDPPNANYTKKYDGTSSATAIVAGVVACLQGAVRYAQGAPLPPEKVRDLLADDAYGTPQADSKPNAPIDYPVADYPIGPLPDLRCLIPAEVFRRDPIDIEMVMDVSGSMNSPSPSYPEGDSKLTMMKKAISIIIDFMYEHGQDTDRMGLIWFTDDVSEYQTEAGQKLLTVKDNDNCSTLEEQASIHETGSCTAMGAGLQTAFDTLSSSVQTRFVVLCTDGMQNIEPKVTKVGSHYEIIDNGTPICGEHSSIPAHAGTDIATYDTCVHAIGVGITANYESLLQDIANETGGFYRGTNDPETDLDLIYLLDLCKCMAGGSPAVVHHSVTKFYPSKQGTVESFYLNHSARRMTVILSWQKSQGSNLAFWLRAPDGTLLDLHREMKLSESHSLVTISLPRHQDGEVIPYVGQWRMIIHGETQGNSADYHTFVIADDQEVKYSLDFPRKAYRVGDFLPIEIKITELEEPILTVNEILIETAHLLVPLVKLLDEYDVELEPGTFSEDPTLQKLLAMSDDPAFRERLTPIRRKLSLKEGDFKYEVRKDKIVVPFNLKQPGLHSFKVTVHCETSRNGPISRIDLVSVYVEP